MRGRGAEGTPIPNAETYGDSRTRATVVQVTRTPGITVKDSPQNTLVFVTRLDNAAPVEGATVSIIKHEERDLPGRERPTPMGLRWRRIPRLRGPRRCGNSRSW